MKPEKRPLVLVHGFLGGSAQWDHLLPALQHNGDAEDRLIIKPDLPGFGRNAHTPAPDTISGFADYVLEDLDKQGVTMFDLLGHSMGGMIVQEMTAKAPDRIAKLCLYGTSATGNLPDRFETFDTSRQRIHTDGVKTSARRISATWFLDHHTAPLNEACAAIAELAPLQAMDAGLTAMQHWSRIDNLGHISCPTQIIWGEHDRTYHWPVIAQLWQSIPHVSLAVLPDCAHASHMEKPELFTKVLLDFLSR